MSAGKHWSLMWRLRLACWLAGAIYFPAAIGTVQLCCGMDATVLVRQHWLLTLMLVPVISRLLVFFPALMALLCAGTMVGETIKAAQDGSMQWPASLTALSTVSCCVGLVSLEVFFWALMGV